MSIDFISVECPKCGAPLSIEEKRKSAFCSYCGAKIILCDENEYTININDEAEVKYAETDRMVNLKHLEMMEEEARENRTIRRLRIRAAICTLIVGLVLMLVGELFGGLSGDDDSNFYFLTLIGIGAFPVALLLWPMGRHKDDD